MDKYFFVCERCGYDQAEKICEWCNKDMCSHCYEVHPCGEIREEVASLSA